MIKSRLRIILYYKNGGFFPEFTITYSFHDLSQSKISISKRRGRCWIIRCCAGSVIVRKEHYHKVGEGIIFLISMKLFYKFACPVNIGNDRWKPNESWAQIRS